MTAAVKSAEWAYNLIVRNMIRLFVSGDISVPDTGIYFDAFARYWHPKIPEAVRNADPLSLVMEFVANFASIPVEERNNLRKDSFDRLLYAISRLELALRDSGSLSAVEGGEIIENLKRLLGKVVGHTVMAFSNNRHQSRILYNQYKGMMSRHQQQGCELVLKGVLTAEKVLQSESEYLQNVKEMLANILNSTSNAIEKVANAAEQNFRDDEYLMEFIEDTDVESSDEAELDIVSDDAVDDNLIAKQSSTTKNKVNDAQSSISNENNLMRSQVTIPIKRRLSPFQAANNHQNSKKVADSSSSIHNIADTKLMPPPLFTTKFKSQHNVSATRKDSLNNKFKEMPVIFRKVGANSGNTSVVSSSTSYSTRMKHLFTPLQDAYIIFGMMKFRNKKQLWCEIYKKYPFPEYRTPTHLKDRWRTLLKRGDVHTEGEKIVASPKYEAIFKHLYTKYEKEDNWEWKGKQKCSKRRLITVDEDEENDDLSIDDLSDDSDLPQQQPSSHSKILNWLNSNTGIAEQEAEPPILSKEVAKNEKPETSGTFVKSSENGKTTHFSDEETLPDTGRVILQPSKSTEYIENVHGKFLPNTQSKTSIDSDFVSDQTHIQDHNKFKSNSNSNNNPIVGLHSNDTVIMSTEQLESEKTAQPPSVTSNVNIMDHNPSCNGTVQNTRHDVEIVSDLLPIDNDVTHPESRPITAHDNHDIQCSQESLSGEELVQLSPNLHQQKKTNANNMNDDNDEEKSDKSMSHELLKLTEQSLHCELMREEDISFISTELDTTVVKTMPSSPEDSKASTIEDGPQNSKSSPVQKSTTNKKQMSTVPGDDSVKFNSKKLPLKNVTSKVSKNQNEDRFNPLEYPASPSTYRTVSPTTSSVYMTADEDSNSSGDSVSNEKTLRVEKLPQNSNMTNHVELNLTDCHKSQDLSPDITTQKNQPTIHDSRVLSEEATMEFDDSHPTSTLLSSTRINCDVPNAESFQTDALPMSSPIEKSGDINDTISASPTRIQEAANEISAVKPQSSRSSIQLHGAGKIARKRQPVWHNPSVNSPDKRKAISHDELTEETQRIHSIRTRRQVAQIKATKGSFSKKSYQGRILRSGLQNRDENRKRSDTYTKICPSSTLKVTRLKRLHSNNDEQTLLHSFSNNTNTAIPEAGINKIAAENHSSPQNPMKYRRKQRRLQDPGVPLKLSKEDEALLKDDQANNINPQAFASHRKPKQRKMWSDTEDKNLIEGVKTFGEGHWRSILNQYKFRNRTAVNLKDRYRVLKQI